MSLSCWPFAELITTHTHTWFESDRSENKKIKWQITSDREAIIIDSIVCMLVCLCIQRQWRCKYGKRSHLMFWWANNYNYNKLRRRKISWARNKDSEQQKINNKYMPKGYWSLKLAKEKKLKRIFAFRYHRNFTLLYDCRHRLVIFSLFLFIHLYVSSKQNRFMQCLQKVFGWKR